MAFISSQSSGRDVSRALRKVQISTTRQGMLIFDVAATSRAVSSKIVAGCLELNRSIHNGEGFLLPETANEVILTKLGSV